MVNIKNNVQVNNWKIKIIKINGSKKKKVIAKSYVDIPSIKKIDTWHEKSIIQVNRAAEDLGFKQGTIEITSVSSGQYDIGMVYDIIGEIEISEKHTQLILDREQEIKNNIPKKKALFDDIKKLNQEIEKIEKEIAKLDVEGIMLTKEV